MTDADADKGTIVLIHGLWMTALCWEHWVARYESAGFTVIARSWPGMEGDIHELRADTTAIDHLSIGEVVDHYQAIIEALDAPPIIMGHSFGGLFVQLLLDRGFGSAGVAIDSAAIKGVMTLPLSEIKAGSPILKNPANRHKSVMLTPEEFHYNFTNSLDEKESLAVWERYAVPGPGHVLFQGALANFNPRSEAKVDLHDADRPPLLFIAGGDDHVIPAKVNVTNAKKQAKSGAITAYKEFPGRTHYTLGQEGWEAVADFALEWATAPVDIPVPD